MQPSLPSLPWWQTRTWYLYLSDSLKFYSHRRYWLDLSSRHGLGATDPISRKVEINPEGIDFPDAKAWNHIRHMVRQKVAFEQAVTTATVAHEAGHIRISGQKPKQATLGWLWNALEDERLERFMAEQYPEVKPLFDFLGDTLLAQHEPTQEMLAGCLLWRWEWDKLPEQRKFTPKDPIFWQKKIQPLVELAWDVDTSDQVVNLARAILKLLKIPEEQSTDKLPPLGCACGEAGNQPGEGASPNKEDTSNPVAPEIPEDSQLPMPLVPANNSVGQQQLSPNLYERDYEAILQKVEGYARDLAATLKPPTPNQRERPHSSRGEFSLERAITGHLRPFDQKSAPAPARSVSLLLLVDESGSMSAHRGSTSALQSAINTAMLINRACELANGVHLGIWGFTDLPEPAIIRPLSIGTTEIARRRIAGITAQGGTNLHPVFTKAVEHLAATTSHLKVLICFHDGALDYSDSRNVRLEADQLKAKGIQLLPLYIGDDVSQIQANKNTFGSVLACINLNELAPKVRTWLRAVF